MNQKDVLISPPATITSIEEDEMRNRRSKKKKRGKSRELEREREVREKKYAQVLEVEFGGDEDDERHE